MPNSPDDFPIKASGSAHHVVRNIGGDTLKDNVLTRLWPAADCFKNKMSENQVAKAIKVPDTHGIQNTS